MNQADTGKCSGQVIEYNLLVWDQEILGITNGDFELFVDAPRRPLPFMGRHLNAIESYYSRCGNAYLFLVLNGLEKT